MVRLESIRGIKTGNQDIQCLIGPLGQSVLKNFIAAVALCQLSTQNH